jgi:microcystin-dependent protein
VRWIALSGALLVLLGSGCGGSGGSTVYSLPKTRTCLRANHVKVGGPLDFVATTATGGALKARLPSNSVTIVFGATAADADNIDQAYRQFHAANVGIEDVLRQQGNAVMLWHAHPADTDLATIADCLK